MTYMNAGHDLFTWSNQKVFMENTLSFVAITPLVSSAYLGLIQTTVTLSTLLAIATL